ncbi:LysE family translocator [Methylopila henanensis]|uniref:LysE family translocator n=1 Tax=Methylopila henanensis TaxID=873516 RepID=A0ABW4KCS6_9HYPH
MTLATLLTFSAALFVVAATPGPGVAPIVARALGVGFAGTLPMVAGLILGDLVWLACAAFGLAVLAASFGTAFMVVKYLGAAYLLWLAVRLWRAPPGAEAVAAERRTMSPLRGFLAGFAVTIGNPKAMVFYLALLPALVDLGHVGALGFAELALATALVLFAVMGFYAALAARARVFLVSPRGRRMLNRVSGATMGAAAAGVAAS